MNEILYMVGIRYVQEHDNMAAMVLSTIREMRVDPESKRAQHRPRGWFEVVT